MLLRHAHLRQDFPNPHLAQARLAIWAVPRAAKRCMIAPRIWFLSVWRSGFHAAMRSPRALRQRILASIRRRTWYPVQRLQNPGLTSARDAFEAQRPHGWRNAEAAHESATTATGGSMPARSCTVRATSLAQVRQDSLPTSTYRYRSSGKRADRSGKPFHGSNTGATGRSRPSRCPDPYMAYPCKRAGPKGSCHCGSVESPVQQHASVPTRSRASMLPLARGCMTAPACLSSVLCPAMSLIRGHHRHDQTRRHGRAGKRKRPHRCRGLPCSERTCP
jgi:hypothetical protein